MKTSFIERFRMHLLVIFVTILATVIVAPNEQGFWAACFTLACYGVLWFVLPTKQHIPPTDYHDEEPHVAYHEPEVHEFNEKYALMLEALEKEAYLRQCGTLN